MNYIEKIKAFYPCKEAATWLRQGNYPTPEKAWEACERADWMLWILKETHAFGSYHQCALEIAETVQHLHPVAAQCNAVTRRYLNDTAKLEAAEEAAAWAAWAARAARAEEAAAEMRKEHADIVRKYFPVPPELP